MALTYFYAEWFGLFIAVIGLAMLANRGMILRAAREMMEERGAPLFAAIISLMFGLLVVLTHNVWTGGVLAVLVTLIGWAMVVKGVLLMLLPHAVVRKLFDAFAFEKIIWAYGIVLLLVGVWMAWSGFAALGV